MKLWDDFVIGLYLFASRHKWVTMIPASVAIALLSFVPVSIGLTKTLMWFIWQVCGFDSVSTMTLFFAGGAWGAWAVMALIEIASWAYDKACSRLYTPYLDALSRRSRGY